MSRLLIRLMTATVYAVVMLAAILYGRPIGLGVVLGIAAMLAVSELYGFTRREYRMPNEVFGVLAAGAMPIAAGVWGQTG
ncbi:MAG: hypothetical protein Q7V14_00190, partial [Coriobacteriia bacterium]|nr:hypothetical protein [Coriobacteriia bacterium]